MNWTKIISNGLIAFIMPLIAAIGTGQATGLPSLYVPIGSAVLTGILAALLEIKKESDDIKGLANNLLVA